MRLSQSVIERGQLILAKERIERVVLRQIKIRNIAKQRCGGSLAVTVDQRHAITLNGQILCQMNCQRRFSDTSFEVLHGHHTARIVRTPPGTSSESTAHVVKIGRASCRERVCQYV